MSVVVGAPSLARHLPGGAVLVIDALASRLASLRSSGEEDRDVAYELAVLAESTEVQVMWHTYSDSRLDGVLAPAQWQTLYPNVTELEQRPLPGQRLDSVLERWVAQREPGEDPIELVVRQGNPLAAIAGLGAWEGRLQRVSLASPRARELWGAAVESLLVGRGFLAVADQPLVWERDRLASCRLECEALARERNGLQQRVGELENRLTEINRELDGIMALLDSADPLAAATAELPG